MAVVQILGGIAAGLAGNLLNKDDGPNKEEVQKSQLADLDNTTKRNLLDLEYSKILEDEKNKLEEFKLLKDIETRKNKNLLKESVATQIAKFGSGGVSMNSSRSAGNVLKGIKTKSKNVFADFLKLHNLSKKKAKQAFDFDKARNLLEKNALEQEIKIKSGETTSFWNEIKKITDGMISNKLKEIKL